jgi:hypothetical protein
MKYRAMAAFAAASIIVSIQPGLGKIHNHLQSNSSHGEGLELGDFSTLCCGGNINSASAQTLFIPNLGFAVQLTANGGSGYAETGVENLDTNPTYLKKFITFNLTTSGPVPSFLVYVDYTLNGGSQVEQALTVANGGLHLDGNSVTILAGTGSHQNSQIPTGARITGLYFDLEQDCGKVSSGSEVANISQVVFDKKIFVNYELDHGMIENESAFCNGGC